MRGPLVYAREPAMYIGIRRTWQRWWPFFTLCAFELMRLNLNESRPNSTSTQASLCIACAVGALACLCFALAQKTGVSDFRELLKSFLAGALLLCGPQTSLLLHPRVLTTSGIAISFALVPVVVAVASAAGASAGRSLTGLWLGIISAAGLALLLPEPNLHDVKSDLSMVLISLLTGLGAVLACRWSVLSGLLHAFSLLLGASFVFACGLVADDVLLRRPLPAATGQAIACDAVLNVLAVASIHRLRPLQYASRFVLVPLAVLVEGTILFRTWPTLRGWIGLCAMLCACVGLLRAVPEPNEELISLRQE
jgi:drug/metabolite transporter (DMT)-like permease